MGDQEPHVVHLNVRYETSNEVHNLDLPAKRCLRYFPALVGPLPPYLRGRRWERHEGFREDAHTTSQEHVA